MADRSLELCGLIDCRALTRGVQLQVVQLDDRWSLGTSEKKRARPISFRVRKIITHNSRVFWLPGGKQKMEFQLALVTLNCDHHTYATLRTSSQPPFCQDGSEMVIFQPTDYIFTRILYREQLFLPSPFQFFVPCRASFSSSSRFQIHAEIEQTHPIQNLSVSSLCSIYSPRNVKIGEQPEKNSISFP